jgi:hypothetical protein
MIGMIKIKENMKQFIKSLDSISKQLYNDEYLQERHNLSIENGYEMKTMVNSVSSFTKDELTQLISVFNDSIGLLNRKANALKEQKRDEIINILKTDPFFQSGYFLCLNELENGHLHNDFMLEINYFYKINYEEENYVLKVFLEELFHALSPKTVSSLVEVASNKPDLYQPFYDEFGNSDTFFELLQKNYATTV